MNEFTTRIERLLSVSAASENEHENEFADNWNSMQNENSEGMKRENSEIVIELEDEFEKANELHPPELSELSVRGSQQTVQNVHEPQDFNDPPEVETAKLSETKPKPIRIPIFFSD